MFGHTKGRLSGAKSAGVVIALGLTGVVGALGTMPAIAADTEGPIQTAEVTPEAIPEAIPEVTPEVTPEAVPEPPATNDHKPEITPETPAFTLPRCEGDEFIAPTVTLPVDTDFINYGWAGDQRPPFTSVPLTVEVYAGLVNEEEEWAWTEEWADDPPDGWRVVSVSGAVYTVKFKDVRCAPGPEPIVPETPLVKSAECVDGELTKSTVTLPADGAATYELHRLELGRSYVVKARVTDGYRWASWEFPDGWVDHGRRLATYTVKFDEVSCEPGAEPQAQPGQLAATGPGDAAVLGGAALLTVAAGVSLIIARRRVTGR